VNLVLEQVSFGYGEREILANLNMGFQSGEMTAVLGNNGIGKSTLLKGILGLVPCLRGDIKLGTQSLHQLTPTERALKLAYLEQQASCHWPLSVRKLVELGRFPHRQQGVSTREQDDAAIATAMAMTDITEFAQRPINQLSGGEQARVMLARALAVDAPVLLVDEPIAGLDPAHQLTVLQQLQSWANAGRTLLVVLHDINMALRFCTRTLLIMPDHQVCEGPTKEVLSVENIRRAFNISVLMGEHEQQSWLVPWSAPLSAPLSAPWSAQECEQIVGPDSQPCGLTDSSLAQRARP